MVMKEKNRRDFLKNAVKIDGPSIEAPIPEPEKRYQLH